MKELRYTLLSDGSSNKTLMPILTWLLQDYLHDFAIQGEWADLRLLPNPPSKMSERIQHCIDLYPCNLLFIHRDAETKHPNKRFSEINEALKEAENVIKVPHSVCVVPVRMMEAWLLIDVNAIRSAAGNPNGTQLLKLPELHNLEKLPNPKEYLHQLLRDASGLHGRRLRLLDVKSVIHRIPEYMADFSPLRRLQAFKRLETQIVQIIDSLD